MLHTPFLQESLQLLFSLAVKLWLVSESIRSRKQSHLHQEKLGESLTITLLAFVKKVFDSCLFVKKRSRQKISKAIL